MKIHFGSTLPPGLDGPTRGELRVTVERLVVHRDLLDAAIAKDSRHHPLTRLIGEGLGQEEQASGVAEHLIEHCVVEPHFWGEEEVGTARTKRLHNSHLHSTVKVRCLPSTPTAARGSNVFVFPLKTLHPQIEQYFHHMSQASSGLRLDVLIPSSTSGLKHDSILGVAMLRLEALTPKTPITGWFTVATQPHQQPESGPPFLGQPPPAVCIGRVKLALNINFFEPGVHVDVAEEKQKKHHLSHSTPTNPADGNVNVSCCSDNDEKENQPNKQPESKPQSASRDATAAKQLRDTPQEDEKATKAEVKPTNNEEAETGTSKMKPESKVMQHKHRHGPPSADIEAELIHKEYLHQQLLAHQKAQNIEHTPAFLPTERLGNIFSRGLALRNAMQEATLNAGESQLATNQAHPLLSIAHRQKKEVDMPDFLKPAPLIPHEADCELSTMGSSTCSDLDDTTESDSSLQGIIGEKRRGFQPFQFGTNRPGGVIERFVGTFKISVRIFNVCFAANAMLKNGSSIVLTVRFSSDIRFAGAPPQHTSEPGCFQSAPFSLPLPERPIEFVQTVASFTSESKIVLEMHEALPKDPSGIPPLLGHPYLRQKQSQQFTLRLLGLGMVPAVPSRSYNCFEFRDPLAGNSDSPVVCDVRLDILEGVPVPQDAEEQLRNRSEYFHPQNNVVEMRQQLPIVNAIPMPSGEQAAVQNNERVDGIVNSPPPPLPVVAVATPQQNSHLLVINSPSNGHSLAGEDRHTVVPPTVANAISRAQTTLLVRIHQARGLPSVVLDDTAEAAPSPPSIFAVISGVHEKPRTSASVTPVAVESWAALKHDATMVHTPSHSPVFNFRDVVVVPDTPLEQLVSLQISVLHKRGASPPKKGSGQVATPDLFDSADMIGQANVDLRLLPRFLQSAKTRSRDCDPMVSGWYHIWESCDGSDVSVADDRASIGQLQVSVHSIPSETVLELLANHDESRY